MSKVVNTFTVSNHSQDDYDGFYSVYDNGTVWDLDEIDWRSIHDAVADICSADALKTAVIACKGHAMKTKNMTVEEITDTIAKSSDTFRAPKEQMLAGNADKGDAVNSPKYYDLGGYEVADVIEDAGYAEGHNRGNAVAYILRAGRKDKSKEIEDLKKAVWHLQREIARMEKEKGDGE